MKKIIKLALSGLTLLSGLMSRNYDPVLEAYAASIAIPESAVITEDLMSVTEEEFENLPLATTETFVSSDIENNSYEYLNMMTIGSTGFLKVDIDDLMPSLTIHNEKYYNNLKESECGTINYLSTGEITHPYEGSPDHYIYYSAFYKTAKTNFWFVDNGKNNQRITFYTELFSPVYSILQSLDLRVIIPVLVINDEFPLLSAVINGKDNPIKYLTHNYCTIEKTKRTLAYEVDGSKYHKISMPFVENIKSIKMLDGSSYAFENGASLDFTLGSHYSKTIVFRMDQSMKEYYRVYPFDIVEFSAAKGYIAVSNNYSLPYSGISSENTEAVVIAMDISYTYTVKTTVFDTKEISVGDKFPNSFQTVFNDLKIKTIVGATVISEEVTNNIHITFNSKDDRVITDNVTYWYFSDQWRPNYYESGEVKIQNIYWVLEDIDTNEEMDFSAWNRYEDVNIHKYSFNASKSIRTYHYNMSGYMRGWSSKDNNWVSYATAGGCALAAATATGPIGLIIAGTTALVMLGISLYKEATINYQCYGFSFYFDDKRTMAIPNIQKVVVKYQCGYERPNTENDGWYPNTADPKKRVVVRTMNVAKDNWLTGCALDDYGMVLTNTANKAMATDDYGNEFDYVIYKEHKVDDIDTYITQMNPLEIYYETEEQEIVRMVGNSMGLHVVLDDDGEYRVYTADGSLAEDYGVYESEEDGTKAPAIDLNEDGVYDSSEVVDSDQGKVLQEMEPYEEPWWKKDENKFELSVGIVLAAIVVIIVLYAILKPQDFAFICKAIGKGFKNLFKSNKTSSSKKKKKTKTKKKSKGKK